MMKKNKLILSSLVLGAGLTLALPATIEAAKITDTQTKGKVGFTTPGDIENDLTIPETDPEVTIVPPADGGFAQQDGIAILAPFFDFGTKEIAQEEQIFDVKPMEYTDKVTSTKKYYLPPMLIVKDLRGLSDGQWSVYAKTTDFTTTGGKTLAGATMSINTALLFNNTKTTTSNPLPVLTDQNVTGDTTNFSLFTSPFTFNNNDQKIMSSINGKGGGQTTLVPDTTENYEKIKAGQGTHYTASDVISGVQLKVPAATIRTVDTYTADITWTLNDTAD